MVRIILLHGIGNWEENAVSNAVVELKAAYNKFSAATNVPFESHFEIIPIDYDQFFREYIQAFNAHTDRFENISGIELDGLAGAVNDFAAKDLDNEDFGVYALGDLFLYLLSDIRQIVITGVADMVLDKLMENRNEPWAIIGHSLGTAVATDVLQYLYTQWRGVNNNKFRVAFKKPTAVMMVANVARLARLSGVIEQGNVYRNEVYPSRKPTIGACDYYLTANHVLDPLTWAKRFDPNGKWDTAALRNYREVTVPADFLLDPPNVHALKHYFAWPAVTGSFFNAINKSITGGTFVNEHELNNLRDAALQQSLADQISDFKTTLEDMRDDPIGNWSKVRDQFSKFAELLS